MSTKFKSPKSGKELVLQDGGPEAAINHLVDIIKDRGYDRVSGERYDWQNDIESILLKEPQSEVQDTVTTETLRPLMSAAIETVIREPLPPLMQISSLYTEIPAMGLDTKIVSGAIGGNMVAQRYGEMQNLPETTLTIGQGFQVATIDKYGVQISISDDALKFTNWPIMAWNFRQMDAALMKRKETNAIAMFMDSGLPLFDNASPASSIYGVMTGRDIGMAANGSFTIDDLAQGYIHMQQEGYTPSVLVMSPAAFLLNFHDQTLRNLFMLSGGGPMYNMWTGNPGPVPGWSNGSMGKMGPSYNPQHTPANSPGGGTASGIAGKEWGMTSQAPIPHNGFPWPLRIMVSPFVPFDKDTELTDIYLVSEGNVGLLLRDESVVRFGWRDEALEKATYRARERYAFATANDGQGIGVFRNVKLARNYWDGAITVQHPNALTAISPTASVV